MANYCGGIKLGASLKLIGGIICDADTSTVDRSKAVSTCGQLWDGALFTVSNRHVITLHNSEGDEVGDPIIMRGNCGVGLDGRFFKLVKGAVELQDGFVLTVNVTPEDAAIGVKDVDGEEVAPISGSTNQFMLDGLGDNYSVSVSKEGYTTNTQTIKNDKDQTITVVLTEARGDV